MKKKILIITYYWPPAGGIAVQRWVKLSKYLSREGWHISVYTVSNGYYQQRDESMAKDILPEITVIKKAIWEPHRLYQQFSKKKNKIDTDEITHKKKSFTGRIVTWIRSNFFIPDARMFWITPSVKFLSAYLKDNPVDVIITTGPPHSVHLIAMKLKQKLNLPWLADFRDPWTSIGYYRDLLLTPWADKKHHQLELQSLQFADEVMVVGERMKVEFEEIRKREVAVITNGFDEDDFSHSVAHDQEFSLVYTGSFFDFINPTNLWKVLSELKEENPRLAKQLKIKVIGKIGPQVLLAIKENGLALNLEMSPFQAHDLATKKMMSAAVLLLGVDVRTKFVLTGKLFEYLGARRPILAFGPTDGDAAKIIAETNSGKMFSFEEKEELKKYIVYLFHQFEQQQLSISPISIENYSHRLLAQRVGFLLDKMTKQ